MNSAPCIIRDAASSSDRGFVLKTWKMQFLEVPPLDVVRDRARMFAVYNDPIDAIYEASTCRLACSVDDADTILGCLVVAPGRGLVHFVYTKPVYRRFGIARRLLEEFPACKTATMWSRMVEDIAPSRGFTYKPSQAWPSANADKAQRRLAR
jgi:GNAT superfamily N-acetyltransferase